MKPTPFEHQRPALELAVTPDLVLRDLGPADAPAFADLVRRNRDHLMAGNGSVPPEEAQDVLAHMCPRWERNFGLGLWVGDQLVGHVTVAHLSATQGNTEALLLASPNGWGLGYWLGSEHTGRGYATVASQALMDYARAEHGATDFYSGTLPHNRRSQAVLERLGFEVYKTTDEFVSYRLLERVSL